MAKSDYNYFSDVENIYNAKVGWNNSTTDEERKKHQDIANAARDRLKAYGYEDVADELSAYGADATAARKIMEKYAPKIETTPTTPTTSSAIETNNLKSKEVNRENAGLFDKYNQAYDDLTKTNPFTTDEAKAIMGKYSMAGLNARDNAVASGGASNGGNIDSYAAANAMRQQAALVNKGQMTVLEARKQKIDNVRNLLSDMGVNIDRVFNQDETAKNNDVARLSEQASVTGYVPDKWTYSNNIYLNSDGTVRDEFLTDEFDSTGGFTTIINNAKAKLATTTDATERANLEATIKFATQAKALKTFSSPKYAKYAHEVEDVAPDRTAEYDTTLKQLTSAEKIALGEAEAATEASKAEAEAEYNKAYLGYMGDVYKADKAAETEYAKIQAEADAGDYAAGEFNGFLSTWDEKDTGPRNFLINVVWKDYINNGVTPEAEDLKQLIINNTEEYNIDVEDAARICDWFDVPTKWLDAYENRTSADNKYDKDNKLIQGEYRGMKPKTN